MHEFFFYSDIDTSTNRYVDIPGKWYPLQKDWITLNIDGAFQPHTLRGGIEGVFHSHAGKWCLGFHGAMITLTCLEKELKALLTGLQLTYNYCLQPLEVEINFSLLLCLIYQTNPTFAFLLMQCKSYLKKLLNSLLHHCFREANRVDHRLAL